MSAATPGPWEARPKRGDTDSWWVTAAPPRPGHRGFLAECVARESQNEANARLIAAAPDLLESCRELQVAVAAAMRVIADLDAMKQLGAESDTREQRLVDELKCSGVANGFGVRATAAIAKAEGREPC